MKRLHNSQTCKECRQISEIEFVGCKKFWEEMDYWWQHVDCYHNEDYCENVNGPGYLRPKWWPKEIKGTYRTIKEDGV